MIYALAIGFGLALLISAVGLVIVNWLFEPLPPLDDEPPPPDPLRDLRQDGGL